MVIHWHTYSSLAVIKFVLILALEKKKTQMYLTGNSYFLSKPQRERQWKMVLIFWQCSQRSFVRFSRCSQNQFCLRFLVELFVDRFLWLYSQNWSHGQFTSKTQNCYTGVLLCNLWWFVEWVNNCKQVKFAMFDRFWRNSVVLAKQWVSERSVNGIKQKKFIQTHWPNFSPLYSNDKFHQGFLLWIKKGDHSFHWMGIEGALVFQTNMMNCSPFCIYSF